MLRYSGARHETGIIFSKGYSVAYGILLLVGRVLNDEMKGYEGGPQKRLGFSTFGQKNMWRR